MLNKRDHEAGRETRVAYGGAGREEAGVEFDQNTLYMFMIFSNYQFEIENGEKGRGHPSEGL